MPRYTIQRSYASAHNTKVYGPWEAGEVIELEQHIAEWVDRDSPGVLAPVVDEPEESETSEPPVAETRQRKPSRDRQYRTGQNRGA